MTEVHEGLETVRVFEASEPYGDTPHTHWREATGEFRKDSNGEWSATIRFWDSSRYGINGECTLGFGGVEDREMMNCKERVHGAMRASLAFLAALAGGDDA